MRQTFFVVACTLLILALPAREAEGQLPGSAPRETLLICEGAPPLRPLRYQLRAGDSTGYRFTTRGWLDTWIDGQPVAQEPPTIETYSATIQVDATDDQGNASLKTLIECCGGPEPSGETFLARTVVDPRGRILSNEILAPLDLPEELLLMLAEDLIEVLELLEGRVLSASTVEDPDSRWTASGCWLEDDRHNLGEIFFHVSYDRSTLGFIPEKFLDTSRYEHDYEVSTKLRKPERR